MSQTTSSASASEEQVVIFPPPSGNIGVLAVPPPYVIGYKPLSDGALGVNYSMVHSDVQGLLVYILSYQQMAVGDHIDVFLGDVFVPVASFPVTIENFDADGVPRDVPFHICASDMSSRYPHPGNQPLSITVKRISGNAESSTPYLLFYKSFPPGKPDIDGGKPFNQGLPLPIASETIIDQSVIDNGMRVTIEPYLHQALEDVVTLAFGPLTLVLTVTNAAAAIIFELTPKLLATLPPTDSLVVRYQLTDRVHNQSGWSDALLLQSKPGITLLPAPAVERAPGNILNHDLLLGGPARVVIFLSNYAKNDQLQLTLQGLTETGEAVTFTYTQSLDGMSSVIYFEVENERVLALIRGSLRLTYTLSKGGTGAPQLSKPTNITIQGGAFTLRPPFIEQVVENELPANTSMAKVFIPDYWALKAGASVQLFWQVVDPLGVTLRYIFGRTITDPNLPLTFDAGSRYIAPFAGNPLTVHYKVINPGRASVQSPLLELRIGKATEPPLEHDLTNFDQYDWNGWRRGPATRPNDWTIVFEQGNYRAQNYTYSDNSAGVVLQKQFANLKPGGRYSLTINCFRFRGDYAAPSLSLSAGGVAITGPITLRNLVWTNLSGNFVASASEMTLAIVSHVDSGVGNDYQVDNLELQLLDL
ncbi:hypothetical protein JFT81_12220 [Pseudomonas sp. TH43]|uniref:hypothetical protein n=1 Tax=Pseudomonas sp. TH43 TaxID=2796407 RepID=UPI0019131350|nr:hypothetical protein [Pseudomonas sp. TH43]MBK5375395.1 hypothetical protein [Pseudomonas sp. TH43]